MKLSDYKGEDGLELLADLMDPAIEILSDKVIADAVNSNVSRLELTKIILKRHKKPIIEILARIEGENPETYQPSALALPLKLLELFNEPEILKLFHMPGQKKEESTSSSVSVSTGDLGA